MSTYKENGSQKKQGKDVNGSAHAGVDAETHEEAQTQPEDDGGVSQFS